MPKTVAQLIAAARHEAGWNQADLAEEMSRARGWKREFTVEQVARLEAGRVVYRSEGDGREPLWWALRVLKIDVRAAKELM